MDSGRCLVFRESDKHGISKNYEYAIIVYQYN